MVMLWKIWNILRVEVLKVGDGLILNTLSWQACTWSLAMHLDGAEPMSSHIGSSLIYRMILVRSWFCWKIAIRAVQYLTITWPADIAFSANKYFSSYTNQPIIISYLAFNWILCFLNLKSFMASRSFRDYKAYDVTIFN